MINAIYPYVNDPRDQIGEIVDPMYFYPWWFTISIFAILWGWIILGAWLDIRRLRDGREPVV